MKLGQRKSQRPRLSKHGPKWQKTILYLDHAVGKTEQKIMFLMKINPLRDQNSSLGRPMPLMLSKSPWDTVINIL